jgi:hypothetical protein
MQPRKPAPLLAFLALDVLLTNQLLYQLSYNGVVRGLAAWKKWNSILSPPENQARAGRV